MKIYSFIGLLLCALVVCSYAESPGSTPPASPTDVLPPKKNFFSLYNAIKYGKPLIHFRLRHETAQQSSFKTANANTLLTHAGFQTQNFYHFSGLVELSNVMILGPQRYNSGGGTSPNLLQYAIINDPRGTNLDQAYLEYNNYNSDIKLGRQRITLDNSRFVGIAPWRQTEQTYAALTINNTSINKLNIFYGYVATVYRVWGVNGRDIFGSNTNHTSLLNIRYDTNFAGIVGYNYFINNSTNPLFSTNTTGIRFNGSTEFNALKLLYTAELAYQLSIYNNPFNYSAFYTNFGIGFSHKTVIGEIELDLQREMLGGNGKLGNSFVTPYCSFHGFQGWAQLFVVTPSKGVIDLFSNIKFKFNYFNSLFATVIFHHFSAATDNSVYGNEIDFEISKSFFKYLDGMVTYGNFSSEHKDFPHTQRLWLTLKTPFN